MGSSNGETVFDVVSDSYQRSVVELSKHTVGVSIPVDVKDEFDINQGDDVVMKEQSERQVLELHFE